MNAIELSKLEFKKKINNTIIKNLEESMSKRKMIKEDFECELKKQIERTLEKSIRNIMTRIDNFKTETNKKFIRISVEMNKSKFEHLCIRSYKETLEHINKIKGKKEELKNKKQIKPTAEIKPRMKFPTIVID